MLTDTHAHLSSETYQDEMEHILARAAAAGVERIVAIGCDVASSRCSLDLAEKYPQVFATVGLHPTYVTEEPCPDWLEQIRSMAAHPRCVGIGETGLDFYHPAPDGWTWERYLQRQRQCFEDQLALAADCGKNVIVHQRDRSGTACWEAIRSMVQPWQGRLRAVFHCWLHPWEEAAGVIGQGALDFLHWHCHLQKCCGGGTMRLAGSSGLIHAGNGQPLSGPRALSGKTQ